VRYLILADMHGNWHALSAVLDHAAERGFDAALILGDLVGYGASPNEVVATLRDLPVPKSFVRGNHDKVAAGITDGRGFNPTALSAAQWTQDELSAENLEFVRELPQGPMTIEEGVMICHGTPFDEDEYLLSADHAEEIFESLPAMRTFFGHTHLPSLFRRGENGIEASLLDDDEVTLHVEPGADYLLNPGSVGQPRDRDPRASYMLLDTDTSLLTHFRVTYPILETQQKIRQAGLPDALADRLVLGI
jgi:diadenosine tetraphosphatase ApaH/serine/threonine PP2A family protein phosphatase